MALISLSAMQACAVERQHVDFLAGNALEHFQPVSHWHIVDRAVAVPDRTELTTSRNGKRKVLVNGLIKDISIPYLFTRESFGDVKVELEFMIPKGSNAGVYLMGRYEVQILDSFGKEKVRSGDLGGIYANSPPRKNAAKAPGRWQSMQIIFRAPRFDQEGKKVEDAVFEHVYINGKEVQKNVRVKKPTTSHPLPGEVASGPIAIQGDHGPIAIRKFIATPIDSPATRAGKEIDAYWAEVERAVREGDFEAYSATTHPHGVIISGSKQSSYPLWQALVRWQSDFEKTKSGQVASEVKFRFSHRYRDTNTSHESGIFRYVSQPQDGEKTTDYIHFEALLTKQDGRWQMLMENQIGPATEEEWDALAP
jgi:hypothetical protein